MSDKPIISDGEVAICMVVGAVLGSMGRVFGFDVVKRVFQGMATDEALAAYLAPVAAASTEALIEMGVAQAAMSGKASGKFSFGLVGDDVVLTVAGQSVATWPITEMAPFFVGLLANAAPDLLSIRGHEAARAVNDAPPEPEPVAS